MPLDLATNAHYLKNAHTLAHLANAAYADDPANHASFKQTVFTEAETFADAQTDTFGYVTADERNVVLAYRGTNDPRDWLVNLRVLMRYEAQLHAKVHHGFADALDAVWDRMMAKVGALWVNGQTFWITGHSLGGALANLTARWLADGWKPFVVATFGQPRVGDLAFAQGYRVKQHRFVNNRDIVATVPPRFIPGSFPPAFYTHVKLLVHFDARGRIVEQSDEVLGVMPELLEALDPLGRSEARAARLVLEGIQDHKMPKYIACLEQNAPE